MRHCRLFKVSIKLGEPQVGANYSSMVEQRLLGTTNENDRERSTSYIRDSPSVF
jgi:hypothetical protein